MNTSMSMKTPFLKNNTLVSIGIGVGATLAALAMARAAVLAIQILSLIDQMFQTCQG